MTATMNTAEVILFKPSGKYYTKERWRIPSEEEVLRGGGSGADSIGPWCMEYSLDFRQISGGPVLVVTQEPWGYPHLIVAEIGDDQRPPTTSASGTRTPSLSTPSTSSPA